MWRRAAVVADSVLFVLAISAGATAVLEPLLRLEWIGAVVAPIAIVLGITLARFLDRGREPVVTSRAQGFGIVAFATVAAALSVPWSLQAFGQDYLWVCVYAAGAAVAGALLADSVIDLATVRAQVMHGLVRLVSVAGILYGLSLWQSSGTDALVALMVPVWMAVVAGFVAIVWDLAAARRLRSKAGHSAPPAVGAS